MSVDYTELGRLVAQAAEGALDAEEHARLEQMLLNNPEAQRFYLEYTALDVELAWNLGAAAPEFSPPVAAEATVATSSAGSASARRRWFLVAAAVVAATAASLLVVYWPFSTAAAPGYATVLEVDGGITIVQAGGDTTAATADVRVPLPATLHAENAVSSVLFSFDDGTQARLSAAGSIDLAEEAARRGAPSTAKAWTLTSGILYAEVAKQPSEAPLVILTPHAEVTVRGTRFTLSVVEDGYTRIDMAEGEVEFRSLGGDSAAATVEAGEYAISLAGEESVETKPLPELITTPKREWPGVTADLLAFPETGPLWGISSASLVALDTKGGREPTVISKLDGGRALPAISLDRSQMALARPSGIVELRTTANGAEGKTLPVAEHPIDAIALAPRARRVAVAENAGSKQCFVKVWDVVGEPKLLATHKLTATAVAQLAWSPDDDGLVIVARGGTSLVVDPARPDVRHELTACTPGVRCAAYSADGRFLALACEKNTVLILDAASRSTLQTLGTRHAVSVLAFSPDGVWLAGALPTGHVRVWRVVNGQEQATIDTKGRAATALAYSADSQELAVHVPRRGVLLFDTAKMLHVLQGPQGDTPSPSDVKRAGEKK